MPSLGILILARILDARCSSSCSQVNEDDEFALLTTHNETYAAMTSAPSSTPVDSEADAFRITTDRTENDMEDVSPKETSGEENNENCNTENMDKTDEAPRKRRKLSPIIYNRSHSPSPTRLKSTALLPTLVAKRMKSFVKLKSIKSY